jgi:hypothetical protein
MRQARPQWPPESAVRGRMAPTKARARTERIRRAPWPPTRLVGLYAGYVEVPDHASSPRWSRLSPRRLMLTAGVAAAAPFAGPPDRWDRVDCGSLHATDAARHGDKIRRRFTDFRFVPPCASRQRRLRQDGNGTARWRHFPSLLSGECPNCAPLQPCVKSQVADGAFVGGKLVNRALAWPC